MQLSDPVTKLKQISTSYAAILEKLDIYTIKDLLTHFPIRYNDTSVITTIKDLILNYDFENTYQIKVKIKSFKSVYLRSRRTLQEAKVSDETGEIKLFWFNQPFLKNTVQEGKEFVFSGKIKKNKSNKIDFIPTYYEEVLSTRELVHLARLTPEYALTEGITKKWLRNRVKALIDNIDGLEFKDELENFKLSNIKLSEAISQTHFPEDEEKLEKAINFLSLYELINIQLDLEEKRQKNQKLSPPKLDQSKNLAEKLLKDLPFELTHDQKKVVADLEEKIKSGILLNDLVQGDVGSGKTIIAILLALLVVSNGYQVVVLSPTTILAKQHYKTFTSLLSQFNIDIELVTSDNKKTQAKDILIGTSAVLARQPKLIEKLGLVVVDEQHKFGVMQREELLKPFAEFLDKDCYPHFVNMTATPIPRTIAQALFGDISINIINTKPIGRLPIKTFLVPDNKRTDSYKWIDEKVEEGEQIYWVCPLISESDKISASSAEETFASLQEQFPNRKVALLHGKLKEAEKSEVMADFLAHKYDILVSTSVIEVGIDVANATVMVIESAERFGLAQLHQIRGRVGRSAKQSWCFLFYSKEISKIGLDRLKFLSEHFDGLKIAEYDLQMRGPGEIYGTKQSGIPFLKIAKLNNIEQIKQSKEIAKKAYEIGIRRIELFTK